MGASLVRAAYQGKNAVLDGYIVTARRSGKHATVSIVDTPALLAETRAMSERNGATVKKYGIKLN